jgi:hypothetical protein
MATRPSHPYAVHHKPRAESREHSRTTDCGLDARGTTWTIDNRMVTCRRCIRVVSARAAGKVRPIHLYLGGDTTECGLAFFTAPRVAYEAQHATCKTCRKVTAAYAAKTARLRPAKGQGR